MRNTKAGLRGIYDSFTYQLPTDICRQTDITDCVDDDFETLIERSNRMKSEKNRLETYTNWPLWSNQRPERLAEAGLYYTGVSDRVECPFCYGVLKQWNSWDVPMLEHGRHFPYCRFIKGKDVGNIPIDSAIATAQPIDMAAPTTLLNQATHNNFAVASKQSASNQEISKHSDMVATPTLANVATHTNFSVGSKPRVGNQAISQNLDVTKDANRLATFVRWPPNLTQTPEILASAGFYHIPCAEKPDRVKCGYCHGKLYNWNQDDDPWVEHARCFPNCPYVKLCLGDKVVEDLQKEMTVSRLQSETTGMNNQKSCRDEATSHMCSEAVQAVLEMGFPQELVKKASEKFSKEGRSVNISAQDLASLALEMEEAGIGGTNVSSHNSQTSQNTQTCAKEDRKSRDNGVPNRQTTTLVCAQTSANTEHIKTIRKENVCSRHQYMCKVCMQNQVSVTFMPCGHLVCCSQCSMSMSMCPVCRAPVTGCVRTYY